jgi:hypothetical protein
MKTYKIPIDWQVYGELEIQAESLDEAIQIAEHHDTPLPDVDGTIDDSWAIDYDIAMELNPGEEIGSEPPQD